MFERDFAGRSAEVLGAAATPELLRALVTHTPIGVFVSDPRGLCLFVNERWCELTGLDQRSALGDGWSEAVHPEDRERVAAEWRTAAAEARDSIVEYRFLRPDGTVCWVKGYASAVFGPSGLVGWVGSCIELTEYHDALEALAAERETLRAAFDEAPIGMALLRPSGRFLRANAVMCELTGLSEAELLERSVADITHPDDREADSELLEQLRAGKLNSFRLDKRYVRPDGAASWASVSVSVIRNQRQEPLHFVVHLEDIHERKLNEYQLRAQADQDSLTGLLNRRCLLERLEAWAGRAPASGRGGELILLDLDNFKRINDTGGHSAGDRALIAAARAMQARAGPDDVLARMGGDEFAIICDPANAEAADSFADELLAAVRTCELDTELSTLTASAGITSIVAGSTPISLIEAADRALYDAKRHGKDQRRRAEPDS